MQLKTIAAAALASRCMAACSGGQEASPLVGGWVQPVPGMEQQNQGFRLAEDGTASSVNMATLQYEAWEETGDGLLVLRGKSIGNGQTISFADTLTIEKLTPDSLTLKKGDLMLSYAKKKQ